MHMMLQELHNLANCGNLLASWNLMECAMAALGNKRQELFAQAIVEGFPPREAYVRAGYQNSPYARHNGSKLKHLPKVARRIEELMERWAGSGAITLQYVQARLLEISEGRAPGKVRTNPDGTRTVENDYLAALLGLAKTLGVMDMQVTAQATAAAGRLPFAEASDQETVKALSAFMAKIKTKGEAIPQQLDLSAAEMDEVERVLNGGLTRNVLQPSGPRWKP
jgi:phage terminase small subunit